MLEFEKTHLDELCNLIKEDNAVLFLGQNYQSVLGGSNYFANEINTRICKKKVKNPSYPNLWAKMSEDSTSGKKEGGHAVLDELQKQRLSEIGAGVPQNKTLSDVLNIGWASVLTSAIDPGIINAEGVKCNPIYTVNTRPSGIADKRRLHITFMFGCTAESNSYPVTYKIRGATRTDAETMYTRVLKEAIEYNGALVIDGWDPAVDWASIDLILGNGILDADMPFPKIYLFSCTPEIKERIFDSERTEELAESDKLIVSESSLFDSLERYISAIREERKNEQEVLETAETISFQRGKKKISLNIPREQLSDLNPDIIHLLKPRDRIQVAFDQEGLRNATIQFLANSNSSFPYWQGYLQGCYFERNVYKNDQKTGLYDRAISLLQASNLHKVNSTIVIHGPSNSGKTVLLGKLALDLSANYPVLFIKGELEADDPDITRYRHQNLVNFINTYLTRNTQAEGKVRAVVIWDNDVFVDKLQNYLELSNELAESNTVLIGSAYEIREVEGIVERPENGVEYVNVSSVLDSTEFKNMEDMFSRNLGFEFTDTFSRVRKTSIPKENQPDLLHDDNRILSLLQRTFRIAGDEAAQIIDLATDRAEKESAGAEKLMTDRFEEAIEKASKNYITDIKGLAEILVQCTPEDEKDEEWYRQLERCAPTLNDMLAVAGRFGISLPLNLVKETICDAEICPDIKYYMDAVDDILTFDTMLEHPFPVDAAGHKMIRYRSPEEAEIYLNSHYTRRGSVSTDIEYDEGGNAFLEDREIYLLEKLIEHGNLEDYSGSNWYIVRTVRELLDQYGTNSRLGEAFAKQYMYKYNELATFILQHGGSKNPEMALIAAFLKREQIRFSMRNSIIWNYNIKDEERAILDDAADGLEQAIEIERRDNGDGTTRMMRLLVEWCTNRNYTLNREHPGTKDIELFRQIHTRFSKALSIYLREKSHRMKRIYMIDVYLNGFSYYTMAMEKLYHVDSKPEDANPIKMSEYTDEISYAMNTVLGKLLDFNEIIDSKDNLNRNIMKVYMLSKKSIRSLEAKARAHGSAAYIVLNARNMWINQDKLANGEDIRRMKNADLYLTSDFAEGVGHTSSEMVECAKNVYSYLTQPDNLSVLLSKRMSGEKEIAGLEMLIRSAWISKTGNVPFTLNQFPKLSKKDWDELHKYCRAYAESGNERARYAFAYYIEGIYYWTFMADSYDRGIDTTPSKRSFRLCESGIRPHGVYPSDSFIFLCETKTGRPVKFNARVQRRTGYRTEADITSAVNPAMITDMSYVTKRKRIYCAQSLQRQSQRNNIESRVITIRFNLEGALAGPENPETEANPYGKE